MGLIKNDEKYVLVEIHPVDISGSSKDIVNFAVASLGLGLLRKAAPSLAESLHTTASATYWAIKDGNIQIFLGKSNYSIEEIREEIKRTL